MIIYWHDEIFEFLCKRDRSRRQSEMCKVNKKNVLNNPAPPSYVFKRYLKSIKYMCEFSQNYCSIHQIITAKILLQNILKKNYYESQIDTKHSNLFYFPKKKNLNKFYFSF